MNTREAYQSAYRTIRNLDKTTGFDYVSAYMEWVQRTPPRWNVIRQKAVKSYDDGHRTNPASEQFIYGEFKYWSIRRGLERLEIRQRQVRYWQDMEARARAS